MNEKPWKTYPPGWPQFPILEITEKHAYAGYKHMMFTLPITLDAKVIVETGLGNGHSTRIFLESLAQLPGKRELYTFELKTLTEVQASVEQTRMSLLSKNEKLHWYVVYGKSVEVADVMKSALPIDFLFLDSLHTYEYLYKEFEAFAPYLSDKAWIMVDDIWHADSGDENNNVNDSFYTRNPGSNPSDLYYAAKDWADKNKWKTLTFTDCRGFGPENISTCGRMLLYREKQ
jgi:hypothetical protein